MRVFVAGGTGVIGRSLIPLLIAAGHQVTATTRSPAKAGLLMSLGAEPAVADGLDRGAVHEAVARARPDVIIHQMTGLSGLTGAADLRHFDRAFAVTNALRTAGTDYLLEAARANGTRRFIAQSFTGWPNARTGGPVATEDGSLDPAPPAQMRESMAAIRHLEAAVPSQVPEGIVLRYGGLYGPAPPTTSCAGAQGAHAGHRRRGRRLVVHARRGRGHRDRPGHRTGPPGDLQRRRRRPGAGRRMAAVPGRDARRAAAVARPGLGRAAAGR